jgi:thymidylate kinase
LGRQTLRIIIEGMDGAGKTTLASALIDRISDMTLIPPAGPTTNLTIWWPEQLDRPSDFVVPVHDRFVYSELVYGPVLRGRLSVDVNLVNNALWFLRMSAFLIYARPPVQTLKYGFGKQQQMKGVHENFDALLEAYDQQMLQEQSWYKERFTQYSWQREGEIDRIEMLVRNYLGGAVK